MITSILEYELVNENVLYTSEINIPEDFMSAILDLIINQHVGETRA